MADAQDLEPVGTYRPQYHVKWRGVAHFLERMPWVKSRLAGWVRKVLRQVFEPGLVTTERVIEYPFIFQHLGKPAGLVLDIGCCHSRLPIALASRGYPVIGFDMHPYPFPHPKLRAVQGDILSTPFLNESFHTILAISTLEHIGIQHYGGVEEGSGDVKAVEEIARLLQPGGMALITVPYGKVLTNDWMRVYDSERLKKLTGSLSPVTIEYGVSRSGLWEPATEAEAARIDWTGVDRAIVMIVAEKTANQPVRSDSRASL